MKGGRKRDCMGTYEDENAVGVTFPAISHPLVVFLSVSEVEIPDAIPRIAILILGSRWPSLEWAFVQKLITGSKMLEQQSVAHQYWYEKHAALDVAVRTPWRYRIKKRG